MKEQKNMEVVLRCNRRTIREDGDKVVTERSFVSTDREGKQLNEGIIGASYSDTIVGDSEDVSVVMHGIVTFNGDMSKATSAMKKAEKVDTMAVAPESFVAGPAGAKA